MSAPREHLEPVGGPLVTGPAIALAALFGAASAVVLYRFAFGLGAVAALNDAYPWGPWKAVSVIVLTAYASGGYAVALLVYVLNRHRFHALGRTALLTSALGYTAAVITLGIDIGRPWNFWRLLVVTGWNLQSVLLEIAVCISTYPIFLWLELAPPLREAWRDSRRSWLRVFAVRWTPRLDRALPWIVAMAIVLPSMHQSSLGSLMLLAGPRLHPYWQTPLLPLLFLLSCWFLGYAFVILASMLSSLAWRRPLQTAALVSLGRVMAWVVFAAMAVRVSDLAVRGQLTAPVSGFTLLLAFEIAVPLAAPALLCRATAAVRRHDLFWGAAVILAGGGLYRLDASVVGLMPGAQFRYFPTVAEMVVTIGFTAAAVLAYTVIVKRFAILPAGRPRAHTRRS